MALTGFVGGCKRPQPIAERDAERIFTSTCVKCHGPEGRGVPDMKARLGVRDLGDPAWQVTISDAQIADSIRRGRKNMPSWGRVLDDGQIAALVAKVRSLRRSEKPNAAPPGGGAASAND